MKNNTERRSLGVYVHVPFCVQKCKYCDFCSFANLDDKIKSEYKKALISDINLSAEHLQNYTVDSIFFGGGTPTCLSAGSLCEILNSVFERYNVSNDAEITLECNPATASKNDFSALVSCGFNRLSMGLQSVHNEELSELGRIHSFEDFKRTYTDAREAGFDNINLDLMYGIPLQTEASFAKTLDTLLSFAPEHISAYALKIEPGTEFYRRRNELILPDEDAEYNMYKLVDAALTDAGYEHYEISNYALIGKKSKHNLKYWSCDEYVGFGVASHSLIENTRYSVTSSIKKYISRFNGTDTLPHFEIEEELSADALAEEYIMMRLRLSDGLSEEEYNKKFQSRLDPKYIERMYPFIKSGHIITENGIYRLTADGMYVSNYILSEILDLNI